MSRIEQNCRWAYARAMRIDSVRDTLDVLGRAVYLDTDGFDPARYVLSRVTASPDRALVYCNGVHVA